MPPQARVSDIGKNPADAHGCPGCPHPAQGPAIMGSTDVMVNSLPALRKGDPGVHMACCAVNMWKAASGSSTVMINKIAAHRKDDQTSHCGGNGTMTTGSGNVNTGG